MNNYDIKIQVACSTVIFIYNLGIQFLAPLFHFTYWHVNLWLFQLIRSLMYYNEHKFKLNTHLTNRQKDELHFKLLTKFKT